MRAYIGVTDEDWYLQLWSRGATEVNFWQPRGGRRFRALERGAPFLFKSHYGDQLPNRIVGFGFFSGWATLTVSRAWEFFQEANGCSSLTEMRLRIAHYRRQVTLPDDPEIGCIMLRDVTFLSPNETRPAPPDWASNIVQGKTYDLTPGSYVERTLAELLIQNQVADLTPNSVPGPVFGDPRLQSTRIGQGAFKALVQEAYGRRCAVTGDKILPVLQSAHIRPVTQEGEHRVDNGILLRSDVHTLFDRGYLGIHPQRRTLMVSPRLRSEWGNGDEFYERASSGAPITIPPRRMDQPNSDFLQYHADTIYLVS